MALTHNDGNRCSALSSRNRQGGRRPHEVLGVIEESGNRITSNRYKVQVDFLLTLPQQYTTRKCRESCSLPTASPREHSALPPREPGSPPPLKVGNTVPQGREPGSLYPSLKHHKDKKEEIAPLRGAQTSPSLHEKDSESEVPPQLAGMNDTRNDTPGNEMAESGPDKTKTAPTTYKTASASKRVTISAMREIDGFPPHRVIDLWNGLAETAGLKPFVEQLDDRMRLRILKRQHEKPDPDWWASKLRDVSRHKWSVEVHGVTLSYLLAESGWQKLCGGEYAPKPPAPRRLSL